MSCSRPLPTSCLQSSLSISPLPSSPAASSSSALREPPGTGSAESSLLPAVHKHLILPSPAHLGEVRAEASAFVCGWTLPVFSGSGDPASPRVLPHLGRLDRVDPGAWDTSRRLWDAPLRCRFLGSTLDLLHPTLTRGPGTGFSNRFLGCSHPHHRLRV